MIRNWTLTHAGPPPHAASLERWLALGGVAGPVLSVLAFTVAGMLRPGYSPIDQVISDLGIDEHAWIVNGSLVIVGLSLVRFAAGHPGPPTTARCLVAAILHWSAAIGQGPVGQGFPAAIRLATLVDAIIALRLP
jgi:Protein of unknown function (DUF998)